MTDEDIARVLKADAEEIVPSSGFVASVMEAVRMEASMPPPIPFPWTRAIPLLAAASLALIALFVVVAQLARAGVAPSTAVTWSPELLRAFQIANTSGAVWIVVASLLALVSVRFAMRVTGARA